jgi:hypothetical protein
MEDYIRELLQFSLLINFNRIIEWKFDHTIYQALTPIDNLRNEQYNHTITVQYCKE